MWTSGTGSLKKTSRVQVHDTWQCLIALIASSKVGARQISRLIRLEIRGDPCCSIELPFSEPRYESSVNTTVGFTAWKIDREPFIH